MTLKDLNWLSKKYYKRPDGICLSGYTIVGMSAIQLQTSEFPIGYLTFVAGEENDGILYIGPEGVTITSYRLQAGDSLDLEMNDLSKCYITSGSAGQTMYYLCLY